MKARYYYIDFLRVVAIVMMFIFHVNMIFVAEWGWHIKDTSSSNVLLEINYWMSLFRMPLLFLVSGFVSVILLERMSWQTFVGQRFQRLLIPTVICTFLVVAPQVYFERKLEGAQFSFLEFYGTFLELKWYPEGNFHWLHLWFIPYLFFYNMLSIPVYYLLKNERLIAWLNSFIAKRLSVLILIALAIIPYTFLSAYYPATYNFVNDIARHSFFVLFVWIGMLFYRLPAVVIELEKDRRFYLALAFLSILAINTFRWNGLEDLMSEPQRYLFTGFVNLNSWFWVLACIGYGKRYLNRESRLLSYCNTAVYPFYILHQTVIVVIGYYVIQTPDATVFKYLFLLIVCFTITFLVCHLFILPNNLLRFVFGLKRKK